MVSCPVQFMMQPNESFWMRLGGRTLARRRLRRASIALLFAALTVLGACSSSGGESTPSEDQSPPMVSITSPATSELAEYVLSGEAADDVGVVELAFRSNQSSERPLLEVEGRFGSFVALEVGDNTIEVVARDAAGNETSSAITVTYRPEPETPPLDEPGGPNSLSAIDQALADGEIDEESAILYRVYAAFDDDRLPSELDVGGLIDAGSVLRDANERFETLSTPAQEALRPYFVPPIYAESWYRDPLGANSAELPVT